MTEGFESHVPKNSGSSKPFRLGGSNNASVSSKYSRSGSKSLKSEIPLSPAVSDPRSEIQHKGWTGTPNFVQPEHKFFTTRSFGFSFYFPKNFQDYDPLDESLMQWKNIPTNDCNIGFPGFSIRLKKDDISYNIKYGASACSGRPKTKAGTLVRNFKKGVWHNFVVEIYNDYREKGGNGYVKIWHSEGGSINKSNDLVVNYKGAVGYKGDEGPYLKLGFYKSLWKQSTYRNESKKAGVDNREMYIDDIFITEGSFGGSPTPPKNTKPTADAGKDLTITLPDNSVTIDGKGTSSAGINSYAWRKVSGPNSSIPVLNKAQLVVEDLEEGTYVLELTVTDKNGNKASDEVKITVKPDPTPAPPTANAGKDLTITLPDNSVTIDGKGTSSVGIKSYAWRKVSGPNSSIAVLNKAELVAEDLEEGTYVLELTVTDKNGNKASDKVKITVKPDPTPAPLSANAGKDLTITLPDNSVTIDGKGTSSVGISSYSWKKVSGPNSTVRKLNQAQLIAEDLEEGKYVYRLTVTDKNANKDSDDVKVTVEADPNAQVKPSISANITDASCTASDGAISLKITGGSAPFTVDWSNGTTGIDLANITSGEYKAKVTDDNGNVYSKTFTVGASKADLKLTSNITNAACDNNDGSIKVEVSGGVGPYNYDWSSTGRTASLNKLSAGTYSVVVSDQNGCSKKFSFEVGIAAGEVTHDVTSQVNNTSCSGDDGSISLQVNGSTGPYSFVWAHGVTGPQLSALKNGNYRVTVADKHGCFMESVYTVSQNPGPAKPDILQAGDSLYVDQIANNYQWYKDDIAITEGNKQALKITEAGTYSIQVTHENSCKASSDYFYAQDPTTANIRNQVFTFQQVEFYPNPAIDNINVRIKLNQSAVASITIFDFQGRVMMTKDLGMINSQIVETLPIDPYPSGAYLIRATANNEIVTRRFLKH